MEDEDLREEVINEEFIDEDEEILEEEVENEDTSEETIEEEQEERMFTQEEVQEQVDRAVQSKLIRERKKYDKEREETERLVDMLKIGTGKENINEIYDEMSDFYKERGYEIPDRTVRRRETEEKVLGKHDAEEIISLGTEDISETLKELSNKKRTIREEETFKVLSVQLSKNKARESLESKGVDTSILDDKKFQDFASKFSSTTPITEIYDFYNSTNGIKKDKPKSMGSVKNSKSNIGEIKDFYTKEEAEKFTLKDFDKNPKLYEAIEKSASKW